MAGPRFAVTCLHCHRLVMVVPRIGTPELEQLREHLLGCCPQQIMDLIGLAGVETTLRHFRVVSMGTEEPPPDAA
jgi:hypothetical protein